ncbi:MAG: hypothetical protein DMD95_08390 [Candidatus Rokuibacteriota bacterium]|nr:MAG: hypothetical protein DMD95_08390 [Candidatus Rokubacteria bacterium]
MTRDSLFPLALLVAYGLAFGMAALGASPLGFDDHPGQLYRLWHVVTRGPAPWAWNPDWWAGYPELQFYPPGFAYAGALLQRASVNALSVSAAYQALVWLAYLAPGLTAFLALARLLRSGWLALPGAFVALTLSAGTTSGVEGGVHIGMIGARLAWALIPLLLLLLVPWIEEDRHLPSSAALLVAAILLTHPAAMPAAVTLIAVGALVRPPRGARLGSALVALGLATAMTAFWALPLVVRLEHTRALAWGDPPGVGGGFGASLALLALLGLARARGAGRSAFVVALFPWAMALVTLVDRFALEPLGVRWLPANRVADGAWIAFILAAGLGWSGPRGTNEHTPRRADAEPRSRFRRREVLIGLAGVLLVVLFSLRPGTFTLWPRTADWPSLRSVERGLRLGDLWTALREAPPGRVLFVRSAVPLVYGAPGGTQWYRPHTHVTALAPVFAGRVIVHGTFTHPSPIAALIYRGDAGPGPITRLAEQLDGRSLFGRPLESLDSETFNGYAERLGISVVVALDEDASRLRALDDNRVFAKRASPAPFLIYVRREAVALPRAVAPGRWTITLPADRDGWVSARTAYYPLWRALVQGEPLATRRGDLGDLEVRLSGSGSPRAVDLAYGPGTPEIAGMVVSVVGGVVWLVLSGHRRKLA